MNSPADRNAQLTPTFFSSAAHVSVFGALALVGNFVAFTLIARALPPAEMGVYNLFVGVSAVLLVLSFDHTTGALLRFGSEEYFLKGHVRQTAGTAFTVIAGTTGLVICALLLLRGYLDRVPSNPTRQLLPLIVLLGAWPLFQGTRFVLQAKSEFKPYSLFPVVRTVALLGAVVLITSLGVPSADTFAWAYVGSVCVAILLVSRWIPWSDVFPLRPSFGELRRFQPWMITILLGAGAGFVLTWADSFALGAVRDIVAVGVYAVPSRLFNQLVVLPELLTVVLMPRLIARKARGDAPWIRRYVGRIIPWTVLAASFMAIAIATAGYYGIPLIYGENYLDARIPFVVLMAGFPVVVLSRLFGPLYAAYDLAWPLLAINISSAVSNLVLNAALIPPYGLVGAAAATALSHTIQAACITGFVVRRLQLPCAVALMLMLPNVVVALLLVNRLEASVAVASGLGAWLVLAWKLRPQSDDDRDFVNTMALSPALQRLARIVSLRT